MANFIENTVTKLEKVLMEAYSLGLSDGNKEKYENPAMINRIKNLFAQVSNIPDVSQEELKIVEAFQCTSSDTFDKEYKKAHTDGMKALPQAQATPRYQEFSNEIDKILADAKEKENVPAGPSVMELGDGMEVEEENVLDMIDPISKKNIINPVKNTVCGHIYEESAIREAIKANARVKCPYLGCGSKQPVREANLVKDDDLRRKIDVARTQRMEETIREDDEEFESD